MPREKNKRDDCEHLTLASITHAEKTSCPANRRNCIFVRPRCSNPEGYPFAWELDPSGRITGNPGVTGLGKGCRQSARNAPDVVPPQEEAEKGCSICQDRM